MLPLIKILFFAALEIAKKKLTGIEITKAQGQEITKKIKQRSSQTCQSSLNNKVGIIKIKNAAITTVGV